MNEKITELVQKIEKWAEDRNIIQGSTPKAQTLKLMEEFGELCGGIAKCNPDVIKDSIGYCAVVLTIIAAMNGGDVWFDEEEINPFDESKDYVPYFGIKCTRIMIEAYRTGSVDELDVEFACNSLSMVCAYLGFSMRECIQRAWDEIKDRKGRMIDGIFVKEEDL